jgi:hypothetical protein
MYVLASTIQVRVQLRSTVLVVNALYLKIIKTIHHYELYDHLKFAESGSITIHRLAHNYTIRLQIDKLSDLVSKSKITTVPLPSMTVQKRRMSDEEKQDYDRTSTVAEDEIAVPPEIERVDPVKGAGVVQVVEEAHFPSVCYCPITKKIMVDPVVGPSGTSFEKEAVMAREGELITYYPNRALKAYIDILQLINDDEGSVRGTLRKLDTNLRTNWDRFVDKAALPLGQSRPLPDGKMIKA